MPSDGNGNYGLPAGYLAVTGELIEASQHNPPLEDIAAGLTARLMRNGAGGMTGVLKLADGTVSAPGLTFNTATSTGAYKTTAGFGLAVSGAKILEIGSSVIFTDGGDTASATALTLGAGNVFNITGTTTITSIATKGVGTIAFLRFNAALTLTHHSTDLILTTGANIVTQPGDWAIFEEYAAGDWRMLIYQRASGAPLVTATPRGYIDGCIISNGTDATNDINIAAGICRDSTNTVDLIVPALAGKQLDANWAPGAAAGMRDSAAGIGNGTYHLHAVRTAASPTADVYASTSADTATALTALQAESGGTDYIYGRRIASIIRLGGTILGFVQRADRFLLKASIAEFAANNPGTSAVTRTLTGVPTGVVVDAIMDLELLNNSLTNSYGTLSSLAVDDELPTTANAQVGPVVNSSGASLRGIAAWLEIQTNTSAQIRSRAGNHGGADVTIYGRSRGWIDIRGKDA